MNNIAEMLRSSALATLEMTGASCRRRQEGLLAEGRTDNVLVERDVLSIACGQYESWPLFK